MPVAEGATKEFTSIAGAKGINLTAEQAILIKQLVKAMNGDTRAATFVRDTSGNKLMPVGDSGTASELEDDGFEDAIKKAAKDVWKE